MKRRKFTRSLATSITGISLARGIGHHPLGNSKNKTGHCPGWSWKLCHASVGSGIARDTDVCLEGNRYGYSSKIDQWKKTYDLKNHQIYNYDNFDSIADNDEIDIVYVVLPNHMHKAFTRGLFGQANT